MLSLLQSIQLFVIAIVIAILGVSHGQDVSQSCLQCICKASSGCKLNTKCHNSGPNAYFCGPYQISWAYWSDAGKPGNTGHSNDFENCLNDKLCAEVAVKGYMSKWQTDCNNDGVIDCLDFAAIHKAGASSCNQQWLYNSQYWQVFRQCHISSTGSNTDYPTRPQSSWNNQPQQPPRPRPTVPPQQHPPSPPQHQPWDNNSPQPQPTVPVNNPPSYNDQPQPDDAIVQPYPPEPSVDVQPYNQPEQPVAPDGGGSPAWDGQPVDSRPYYEQPQPPPSPSSPSLQPNEQPYIDPWDQPYQPDYPSNDNYSQPAAGAASPPGVTEPDPWDEVSRAVDEVVDQPYGGGGTTPNRPVPTQPALIPGGRAPVQPVSWSQPPQPSAYDYNNNNNFGQPFKPPPPPPRPTIVEPSQPLPVEAPTNASVDDRCLDCICQASSDCDLNKQCEGSYCGPYLISWAYWADAGQPGGDYATCANNRACAENTVRGYMSKWQSDCDGNGYIDCDDFVRIHRSGPHSCNAESIQTTDYWKSYQSCKSPPIEARRLDTPTNSRSTRDSLTGRSVPQSPPGANLFLEYPNPVPNNRHNNNNNYNPLPPNHYARDSRITFPRNDAQPAAQPAAANQPNRYEPTAGSGHIPVPPISSQPVVANNYSTDRALESIGLQRDCLDCICQASSKCNQGIGCQNDGSGNGYVCGPYQMNWAYWSDADKPGIRGNLENLENYQSCLTNKACSESAIYGYMKKHRRDCNEDQRIDCFDMAAIHMAGPTNCNAQWFYESQYWSDFRECFDFRRRK
ncbi:uncharacterized protein LOC128952764 [Oppia nitens]|uniref:uncharacterized protein LOC128952764 n=1 Tax=Oppia nitens TaxID=1686743 RepID=UPI0023DA2F36|nr:uncharacterized protein LOC128952764 [Oppia nitens]